MKRICGWAVVTAIACCLAGKVKAQVQSLPKWEFGLSGGPFIYQGDLAPSIAGSFKLVSPGVSLSAARIVNRFVSLRTQLSIAELRGDDLKYGDQAWRRARALRFHTSAVELAETLVWDLYGNNDNERWIRLRPYFFVGVGYTFLQVRRDANRFDSAYFGAQSAIVEGLKADLRTDPPRGVLVVPMGAGIRYAISPAWSVNLEADYRFSETDYLDGFSRVGNDGRNDHYYSITLGVLFTVLPSKGMKCPALSKESESLYRR